MNPVQHHPEALTTRAQDYSQWYQEVISAADLAEHAPVKGCMIIKPAGYALWEKIQSIMEQKIKATGCLNAYFPLFIPESFLTKEKEHVEGFSPELAVVTHAGGEPLEENLVVRPTSETIMYHTFARWIHSWRDLPLLINQWANVVRWEKRPRLFLRTTEFLWQEGHTAHATETEADVKAREMLSIYEKFCEEYLAMPVISGKKSEQEKFAGARTTYTIEAMMQDGKALQMGTSHHLGQNFSKAFDIQFTDQTGARQYVWQTSWGVSTRLIGGLIMAHSDDQGLILPPNIAPLQIMVIPIQNEQNRSMVMECITKKLTPMLKKYTFKVDQREHISFGWKINECEKQGIPIRVEIGPKEMDQQAITLVRRDIKERVTVPLSEIKKRLAQEMKAMQKALFQKARKNLADNTWKINQWKKFETLMNTAEKSGFSLSPWCGSSNCEEQIKEKTKATVRCIPFQQKKQAHSACILCGNPASYRAIFAKAY